MAFRFSFGSDIDIVGERIRSNDEGARWRNGNTDNGRALFQQFAGYLKERYQK